MLLYKAQIRHAVNENDRYHIYLVADGLTAVHRQLEKLRLTSKLLNLNVIAGEYRRGHSGLYLETNDAADDAAD